jgi:hypothetical protein
MRLIEGTLRRSPGGQAETTGKEVGRWKRPTLKSQFESLFPEVCGTLSTEATLLPVPSQSALQGLFQGGASLVILVGGKLSLLALDLQFEQLFLKRCEQKIGRFRRRSMRFGSRRGLQCNG